MRIRQASLIVACLMLSGLVDADEPKLFAASHAFYAMDTAFQRKGLATDEQLDVVQELGYDGIAWTEAAPNELLAVAEKLEKRGLKMHAIYCQATVCNGQLSYSPQLQKIMETLKGRGTVIWLHIGGKRPAFDTLTDKEPLVKTLLGLADVTFNLCHCLAMGTK